MTIADNEMMFIYNSGVQTDRVALGYAQAVKGIVLKERDTRKEPFTETQLKRIADKLGVTSLDLIDKKSELYQAKYRDADLAEHDVLMLIKQEPDILRTPIVLYSDYAEFVDSKYDFVKRGMASPDITSKHANKEEKSADRKPLDD